MLCITSSVLLRVTKRRSAKTCKVQMVCIDLFLILSCKLICNEKAATSVPRKKKKKKFMGLVELFNFSL